MRIILLSFLFVTYSLLSQNIRLYDTDISEYPVVSSKIVVFNNFGEQVTDLDQSSIVISENGTLADILDLSCSEPEPPVPVSGVLLLDISSSMIGDPIELAKQGALSWINFKRPSSETSIIGFSDMPFLFSDYSKDKDALRGVVNNLELFGGTDVNRSFIQENTGALDVAARGNYKKVIILLTDGIATVNDKEIIQKANELGAQVYSIILYNDASSQLRSVSNATGGFVYDNVSSPTEIINIYRTIFKVSESIAECNVTFRSSICERRRKLNLSYADSLFGRHEYNAQSTLLPQLNYPTGQFIVFDNINQGQEQTSSVLVTADFFDIRITDIISSNSFFTVEYPTEDDLPLTIKEGESEQIRVKFSYQSDKFEVAELEIVSNACLNEIFYASGGTEASTPGENSIKVLSPNGNEIIASGSSNTVTWSGTLPDDKVKVELTVNGGEDWNTLSNDAENFEYLINYPDVESNECLVRLTQFSEEFGRIYLEANTNNENVNAVSWSPLGNTILTANVDGYIREVNSFNGDVVLEFEAHSDEAKDIIWSKDGIRFASVSFDSTLKIWNSLLNEEILSIKAHDDKINCLAWSSDGQYIATGGQDNLIKIWNGNTYDLLETIDLHTQEVNALRFSPNNEYLASCANDSLVKIVEVRNWEEFSSWKADLSDIRDIDWLNQNEVITVSDRNKDNSIRHWDIDGNLIKEIDINEQLYALSINRDKKLVALAGLSGTTHLLNTDDFSVEIDYQPNGNPWRILDVDWSPDGSRFVNGIYGKNSEITMQFFSVNRFPSAQDVSDNFFTLTRPDVRLDNINMGVFPVDRIKEQDFFNIFNSQNELDIRVEDIVIENDVLEVFDLDFSLVDGNIEKTKFYFAPKQDIAYNANLRLVTNVGDFTSNITGVGIVPDLPDNELDFGDIVVGNNVSNTISLKNSSGADLEITSISIINQPLSDYSITNLNQSNILEPDDELILNVDFSPSDPTYKNSVVRVEHDGANSPSIINLLGRGIEPGLNFNLPDTLYYSCYSANQFDLEISNNGIGNLQIIEGIIKIGELDYSINNLNLGDGKTEIIPINYENWDKESPLTINFNTNNGDFNFEIPIRELISSFTFNNGNNLEFFQTIENNPETKSISFVNDGETILELSQVFPILLRNGLITINYTGPLVINPGEETELSVDFAGGDFGEFGVETFSLVEKCGFENSFNINWNIQTDSDPIFLNQLNNFDALVCENKDTMLVRVENISDNAITISLDNFNDPDNKFNILNFPNSIAPLSDEFIEVEFNSLDVGSYSSTINFSYLDLNKSAIFNAIKENIDYSFDIPSLEFENGTIAEFSIINEGSTPLNIPVRSDFNGFEIITATPQLINPNETSILEISYFGSNREDSTFVKFDFSCGYGDSLFVKSIDSTLFYLNISIPEISANIDDIIDLEAVINTNIDFEDLQFDIKYNRSLLKYLGNNPTDLNNEHETVYYTDITSDNYNLGRFQVLWGNDSTTSIELNNIALLDAEEDYSITKSDGYLKVLDLCYEGGVRLYFSPDLIITLGPNPTSGIINLNYSSKYKTTINYKLRGLVNSDLLESGEFELSGSGSHQIDLSKYANGAYYLEIRSDNYSDNIKIIKH